MRDLPSMLCSRELPLKFGIDGGGDGVGGDHSKQQQQQQQTTMAAMMMHGDLPLRHMVMRQVHTHNSVSHWPDNRARVANNT